MGTVHALHPHRLLHPDLGLKSISVRSYHPCYSRLRSERHVVAVRTFPSIPMSWQILNIKRFYRDYSTKSTIQNRNFAQNPFHFTHRKSRPCTPTEMRLRRDNLQVTKLSLPLCGELAVSPSPPTTMSWGHAFDLKDPERRTRGKLILKIKINILKPAMVKKSRIVARLDKSQPVAATGVAPSFNCLSQKFS